MTDARPSGSVARRSLFHDNMTQLNAISPCCPVLLDGGRAATLVGTIAVGLVARRALAQELAMDKERSSEDPAAMEEAA